MAFSDFAVWDFTVDIVAKAYDGTQSKEVPDAAQRIV